MYLFYFTTHISRVFHVYNKRLCPCAYKTQCNYYQLLLPGKWDGKMKKQIDDYVVIVNLLHYKHCIGRKVSFVLVPRVVYAARMLSERSRTQATDAKINDNRCRRPSFDFN